MTAREILESLANDKYPTWEKDVDTALAALRELVEKEKELLPSAPVNMRVLDPIEMTDLLHKISKIMGHNAALNRILEVLK